MSNKKNNLHIQKKLLTVQQKKQLTYTKKATIPNSPNSLS